MNEENNNAEKMIIGLSNLFEDVDSFPEGEIKQSIEKIKVLAKDLDNKNKKISNNESK